MKTPCKSCPWRLTTRSADIPGHGGICADALDMLRADGSQTKAMACHVPTLVPVPCAGFVVQVGYDSQAIRIAARLGRLNVDDYSDGGAELYPTMDAMCAAHPDPELTREA